MTTVFHPGLRAASPSETATPPRLRLAPESVVLAVICLLDLCSTIFWVSYRHATEGNPVMAYYLTHWGIAGFAAAKMVLLAMPLLIAEYARRTNPRFVHNALRFGIIGYISLYSLGVFQINVANADDDGTGYKPTITAADLR